MNYKEAIEYIEGSWVFGSKLGLESITRLTELLGSPQKKLKFVHVAGTNGKGSVSSFISGILTEAGYKTGLLTSPHLERFEERIRIDGAEISEDSVASVCGLVRTAADELMRHGFQQPTEFELVTAMALVYFNRENCDFVVLEVGLGGRLDATNVIDAPEAAVITAIDYDHTNVLGSVLPDIAFEKAGIIKRGGAVVTYSQKPEVAEVLKRVCAERGAVLNTADADAIEFAEAVSLCGQTFSLKSYKDLKVTLLGEHQAKNAALAVKTAEILRSRGWSIPERAIREGLYKTKWAGRFELIRRNPAVILDGAHNNQGAQALSRTLKRYFSGKKIFFIMGVLADKSYIEMLEAVLPIASRFYTVTPDSERALPADELARIIKGCNMDAVGFDTISGALSAALSSVKENEIICCFGSLYFIGGARKILMGN